MCYNDNGNGERVKWGKILKNNMHFKILFKSRRLDEYKPNGT